MALAFLRDDLAGATVLGFMAWCHALAAPRTRSFLRGYLGGFAYLLVGLSWMHQPSSLILVATAAYYSLYFGLFAFLADRAIHRHGWPAWLVAPLALYAIETLKEHLSLFPATWMDLGQVVWRWPLLAQVAELGGIQLVSLELALVAAGLYHAGRALLAGGRGALGRRSTWLPPAVAVAMGVASAGYGAWRLDRIRLEDGPRVALVQANVPQGLRNQARMAGDILDSHARLSREAIEREGPVDIIAWPETAVNLFIENDPEARVRLGDLARELHAYLLFGAFGTNERPIPPSNSAFLIDPEGRIAGRADKRILVPFGETLPVLRHIPALRDPLCNFLGRTMHFRPYLTPGAGAVVLHAGALRIGTLICYADTVPSPGEELLEAGVEALFTLSNEAWFGQRELDQHLAMATTRAIETRLPLARATNTGATCIIDPAGRIVRMLPIGQAGTLVGTLPVTRATPVPPWLRHAVVYATTGCLLVLSLAWRRPQPGRRS